MDVVGAIGGAAGAAMWAVVGSRLVSSMRPSRQMTAFTAGTIVCALAGGLFGSALDGAAATDGPVVRAAAISDPVPSLRPEPTTTTTTPVAVTMAPTTTTTTADPPPAKPATRRTRRNRRRTTVTTRPTRRSPVTSHTITARCADGWGIYGRNRSTTACDAHGGVAFWIIEPTN